MDAIEKGVNEVRAKNKDMKGLAYMRIDGSTPPKQREDNVNAFQNDQACRVSGAE
jgi:SNF2 family DNA or RNA helicase